MGDIKYDVFISYSRKDFDEVNAIRKLLQDEVPGLRMWFDIDGIESGDEFEDKIISAIDNSSHVIFALSDNSLQSQWTKDEVIYAKNTEKKVIPLLLNGAVLKGWFLFRFGRVDCIDTTDHRQLQKLMANLRSWCRPQASRQDKPGATPTEPVSTTIDATCTQTKRTVSTGSREIEGLKQKAEDGDVPSIERLTDIYFKRRDYQSALAWCLRGIKRDSDYARGLYLNFYKNGIASTIFPDKVYAVRMASYTDKGYADLMYHIGLDISLYNSGYNIGGEYGSVIQYLSYLKEDGIQENEFLHYLEAAKNGYLEAQLEVAERYEKGLGTASSGVEALKWYKRVYDAGKWDYSISIAYLYYSGVSGLDKDYAQALFWYKDHFAHYKTHKNAPYFIARIYEQGGFGVKQDIKQAIHWYTVAANNGNETAERYLKRLTS